MPEQLIRSLCFMGRMIANEGAFIFDIYHVYIHKNVQVFFYPRFSFSLKVCFSAKNAFKKFDKFFFYLTCKTVYIRVLE